MHGRSLYGKREISSPTAGGVCTDGPHREGEEPKPMMYELKKSHSLIVPMKSANKTGLLVAEPMEGSGGIARNADLRRTARTLCRLRCVPGAARIRMAMHCGRALSARDKNRMREFRTYGSVRGVCSNAHPYRDVRRETGKE